MNLYQFFQERIEELEDLAARYEISSYKSQADVNFIRSTLDLNKRLLNASMTGKINQKYAQ